MQKDLEKYIQRVIRIDEHILALLFSFKGNKKFCVIQVYLPSNKQTSSIYQGHIQRIIKEEKLLKANIIIMGDFNAVNNPIKDRTGTSEKVPKKKNWRPEIPLFPYLEDLGFSDIQSIWEDMTANSGSYLHTWKQRDISSWIDYIWVSQKLALNNIRSFSNKDFNYITNSDHTFLQVTLYKKRLTDSPRKARGKRREPRIIFDLK